MTALALLLIAPVLSATLSGGLAGIMVVRGSIAGVLGAGTTLASTVLLSAALAGPVIIVMLAVVAVAGAASGTSLQALGRIR